MSSQTVRAQESAYLADSSPGLGRGLVRLPLREHHPTPLATALPTGAGAQATVEQAIADKVMQAQPVKTAICRRAPAIHAMTACVPAPAMADSRSTPRASPRGGVNDLPAERTE
jgi:hypothetical protein